MTITKVLTIAFVSTSAAAILLASLMTLQKLPRPAGAEPANPAALHMHLDSQRQWLREEGPR